MRGVAGFGKRGTPALSVGTRWDTRAIWLRTSVRLPALGPHDVLTLRLFHDEDVEVFVNGQPLLREPGFTTSYGDHVLSDAQKALFRPGPNLVAVTCRQTQGGQGIDLGLTLDREE